MNIFRNLKSEFLLEIHEKLEKMKLLHHWCNSELAHVVWGSWNRSKYEASSKTNLSFNFHATHWCSEFWMRQSHPRNLLVTDFWFVALIFWKIHFGALYFNFWAICKKILTKNCCGASKTFKKKIFFQFFKKSKQQTKNP